MAFLFFLCQVITDLSLERLFSLQDQFPHKAINLRQLPPVLLSLCLHIIDVSLDVIGQESESVFTILCYANFFIHSLLLSLHSFLHTDDLMRLMLVRQNAINAENLQIFFTECFQLLVML